MAGFDELLAQPPSQVQGADGQTDGDVGGRILHELVKSYGFRRDDRTGEWDWSIDNIGKAFSESPVWTTLDYLTLAAPVAKWGVAAGRVARGAGAAGAAYEAVKAGTATRAARAVLQEAPRTLGGRLLSAVGGTEFGRAAELATRAPARSQLGQFLENPVTGLRRGRAGDRDYLKLIEEGYGDSADTRGLGKMLYREQLAERAASERGAAEVQRGLRDLSPEVGARVTKYLETPFLRPDAGGRRETFLRSKLGDEGFEAYAKTWRYREQLHQRAYDLKLISRDTYLRNLQKWAPRLYDEFLGAEEKTRAGLGSKIGPMAGRQSLKARTIEAVDQKYVTAGGTELKRIWDPRIETQRMLAVAQVVAKQEYAQKLANSAIAKNADELLEWAAGKGSEDAGNLLAHMQAGKRVAQETIDDLLVEGLGWKRVKDLFPGRELPGYLKRLAPTGILDKYIDPAALEDVVSMFKFADDSNDLFSKVHRGIYRGLAFFRTGKTAYNPATHVRNTLSNAVFHSFATGRFTLAPTRGFKAVMQRNGDWREAVEAGVVGSGGYEVIRDALKKAGLHVDGDVTQLDFLGDSRIAKMVQNLAGKAEDWYRAEDDLWKIQAFTRVRDKYLKTGKFTRQEAIARASLEVTKFMPSFNMNSKFTDLVGGVIPFASFTNEALRIWKNAMTDKPHLAFFWNNIADAMSQAFGAAAGMSQEELAEIHSKMPDFQQGKQMMLLPFKIDGKSHFFDLSYLIPLAGNMGELQTNEKSFFINELYDATTNPLIGGAAILATGTNPFSGREVEPRFVERQLGIGIDSPQARRMVGLAEWATQTMLPPLAPPGFAGVNLLEAVRGQVDPFTTQELEPNVARTVAANIFGMRSYEATLPSQVHNIRREETRLQERRNTAWKRWEFAKANGDIDGMESEKANILAVTEKLSPGEASDYWAKGIVEREPGKFRRLTTKQLKEALSRSRGLELTPEELEMRGELYMRLEERSDGGRRRRRRRKRDE
jgi:hypothetical protein